MRLSLAILALVAVASTSTLLSKRQFPDCAENCLVNADFGSCAQTDDVCLCNSSAFIGSLNACIDATCTGSDLTVADSQAIESLCAAVGVTLTQDVPSPTAAR